MALSCENSGENKNASIEPERRPDKKEANMQVYMKIEKRMLVIMVYEHLRYKEFSVSKSFTTEPKIPRKQGNWRSVENIKAFMYHLWRLKLKKCSYETLLFEFERFFGTNDTRTVERYIGRPDRTVYSSGSAQTTRMNRNSGRVAVFEYHNARRMKAKPGLMRTLGYITMKPEEIEIEQGNVMIKKKTGNWIATIHHEKMSYYTEQVTLETANLLPEVNEDSKVSNVKVCVSSLSNNPSLKGEAERFGEPALVEKSGEGSPTNIEVDKEKKEEEVIDSTHTRKIGKIGEPTAEKHTTSISEHILTPEALAILNAKPLDSEPDRSKPIRRADSG